MAVALGVGAVHVPVDDVLAVVGRRFRLGDLGVTAVDDRLVWQMRMPRVLAAAAVGAALAVCGAVLQSITRNDLADPYRSEEHTSELQSLMRISYAVFCLKTNTQNLYEYIHY